MPRAHLVPSAPGTTPPYPPYRATRKLWVTHQIYSTADNLNKKQKNSTHDLLLLLIQVRDEAQVGRALCCHPIYSVRQVCGCTSPGHTWEGHTGFLLHLLSAVLALIFLARRIQPFLSLVDREVEFCVLNRSPDVGIYLFIFGGKIPVRVTTPRFELSSQRQRVSRLPTEPPGRPVQMKAFIFCKPTVECVSSRPRARTYRPLEDVPTIVHKSIGLVPL